MKYIARKGKPIVLAMGMCTMGEVWESVSAILGEGNPRLMLLHAVTSYPTNPPDVNLLAMKTMMKEFSLPVGYSDHTVGTVACVAAVAMGATLIEKHFTIDKSAEGPDHMLSADPAEMKRIVEQVRLVEIMMGSGVKMPAASETLTRINNRKSIVAAHGLAAGQVINGMDIAIKRPGYGIEPKYFEQIIGRRTNKEIEEDDVILIKGDGVTGIVLQARMGFSRLPGKVMTNISGRPMLGHILDRLKRVSHADVIIVATTTRELDNVIETFMLAEEGFV